MRMSMGWDKSLSFDACPIIPFLGRMIFAVLMFSFGTVVAAQHDDCPISLDMPFPGWHAGKSAENLDWLGLYLACTEELKHPRNGRWPMIVWTGVAKHPLDADEIEALLKRGLVQHVPMDVNAIPTAKALQAAGAPVVIMDARGGSWPYSLLPDDSWRLEVDNPMRLHRAARVQADPTRLDAWRAGAEEISGVLRAFKQAGVRVDAVWLDYETQPLLLDYQTVRNATLARPFPADVMVSEEAFIRYRRQLWLQLVSAYIAEPIRAVYPRASTTNWIVALSSTDVPVLSWHNWHHPQVLTTFSATNPVAYAIDSGLLTLAADHPPQTQFEVDQLYFHMMLRQVTADAWNRKELLPRAASVPWVSRRVVDENIETPEMSREVYREALRHLWLRDVDAMQVFNPADKGAQWRRALAEVQDAQHVYKEMLAAGDLLHSGEVMNYQLPMPGEQGIVWSGLRDEKQAFVRVFRLGGKQQLLRLEAWEGKQVLLPATEQGRSYRLLLTEKEIRVESL